MSGVFTATLGAKAILAGMKLAEKSKRLKKQRRS